ncbi:MAG: hypothetical protein IJH32_05600 [Ruminococcus sp.]|nr:hypothetical protein [Ruminococcus sp.]
MKYLIVAELRENHPNLLQQSQIYNDYVSKKSMMQLANACKENGYDCEYYGGMDKLISLCERKDSIDKNNSIIINYNYGFPAQFKRGQSPIFLEMLGIKYSGSDPLVSLIVNDKSCCKRLINNSVKTPRSIDVYNSDDLLCIDETNISLPVVVKPNSEGSSLGIDEKSLCYTYENAVNKASDLLKEFCPILIEEYIPGYEVTTWIIGNKGNYSLVQPLIISVNGQYYFESKVFTTFDKANHIRSYSLPQNILNTKMVERIKETAQDVFEILGMHDYGRIDFRIHNDDIFFIEANALPIFSQTSEIGQISDLCNIKYNEICRKLIETITKRLMPETY